VEEGALLSAGTQSRPEQTASILINISDIQYPYIKTPAKSVAMTRKDDEADMCDMRGMLSFMILWLLSKRPMYGQQLASEIGKRRGERPNPGTIYPALKDLSSRSLIAARLEGRNSVYELTEKGKVSLLKSMQYFDRAFGEILSESKASRGQTV
jgi:DNA-binding PadR family transcriptional regulator